MTAHSLLKLHHAAQTAQAWQDWHVIAEMATVAGYPDLVIRYRPDQKAGWKTIDRAIAALRSAIEKRLTVEAGL